MRRYIYLSNDTKGIMFVIGPQNNKALRRFSKVREDNRGCR